MVNTMGLMKEDDTDDVDEQPDSSHDGRSMGVPVVILMLV